MTEERLKEIKNSLDTPVWVFTQRTFAKSYMEIHLQQELELYNEVVRLREIHNKALEWFKYADRNSLDKLYNILNKSNLTLEQLNGIENE